MSKPTHAFLSQSQIKLPPFKYEVSGPGLCPGRLYRVESRSDEHRAEYFAVVALAAVTGLPAVGWEDAPGRVVIAAEIDQITLIQDKIRLVAAAWGVALPDPGRVIFCSFSSGPVDRLYAGLDVMSGALNGTGRVPSEGPFALVIIDQLDVFEGPRQFEQYRLLTGLKGNPAVAVGQAPYRQINHPIIVGELKAKAGGAQLTEGAQL